MKTKKVLAFLTVVAVLLLSSAGHAATITAAGSGNWTSIAPNAPWPGGVAPQPTDNVTINTPNVVTVDTNVTIDYITGSGTLTMATNSTLIITGTTGGTGLAVATLNATATGNTVNYSGNTYFTEYTTYYNLIWSGYGGPFVQSPLTVLNDFTMSGSNGGQAGSGGLIVGHDLSIGPACAWDMSCPSFVVSNNTTISGRLTIGCGSGNIAQFKNVTVDSGGTFNLGDTIRASISGNLTNNGTITGTAHASIHFTGIGQIAGSSPVSPPTVSFEGTTTIGDALNLTYTPDFLSTVVFDLANPQTVTCAGTLFFGNTLTVINTGGTLTTGSSYQLFSAPSYNDPFSFATINLPGLSPGLSWVNNLTTTGTISITGTVVGGAPVISLLNSGGNLTLTWDDSTFPGYTVQAQTNSASVGISNNWINTGSGTPYTVPIDPSNPSVFFRLVHP